MSDEVECLKKDGKALLAAGKVQEALPVFSKLAELDPASTYFLDVLGFLNYMNGNFKAARDNCLASLALKPENYYAHKGLGLCLVRLGETEKGIAELKKSISLNPQYFDSYYDLGVTYLEIKDFDQARHYFSLAGEVNPARLPEVRQALARVEKARA